MNDFHKNSRQLKFIERRVGKCYTEIDRKVEQKRESNFKIIKGVLKNENSGYRGFKYLMRGLDM